MGPEKLSHAEETGTCGGGVLSVRLEMVGWVYCVA